MTVKPLAPAQIEAELVRLVQEMEEETERLATVSAAAAEAEANFKIGFAKAFLAAWEKTEKGREADATERTGDLLMERRIRESDRDVCQEKLRSIRAAISAYQTIAANVREQTRP